MKKIKILKNVKASPSLGKVCDYKEGQELVIDNINLTESLYNWFLQNNLAVEVKAEISTKEFKEEEKAIEKAPENKAMEAPENKSVVKTSSRKRKKKN